MYSLAAGITPTGLCKPHRCLLPSFSIKQELCNQSAPISHCWLLPLRAPSLFTRSHICERAMCPPSARCKHVWCVPRADSTARSPGNAASCRKSPQERLRECAAWHVPCVHGKGLMGYLPSFCLGRMVLTVRKTKRYLAPAVISDHIKLSAWVLGIS